MRRHDEKLQRLSEVTLFRRCDRKELEHLAGVTDELSLPAGAVLCQEGALARECFVLVTGEADVTVEGRHVGTVVAGQSVGEMGLLDHAPRSATVVTTTPVVAYVIQVQRFDALIERSSEFARALLREMSGRIRDLDLDRSRLATSA